MGLIKDLFLIGMSENINKSQDENDGKTRKTKQKTTSLAVMKCAYLVGLLMILLAIGQMFLTMYYPVSPYATPLSIYFRNISTFIAVGMMGVFLIFWCNFVSEEDENIRPMKGLRFVTLLTCAISVIKGFHSIYILYYQFHKGTYVIMYYLSDGITWIVIATFLAIYYRLVLASQTKSKSWKNYKKFLIFITVVCFVRTGFAILYTLLKYNPYFLIWTYYLASAIAWLFLSIFFSFYCSSNMVLLEEGKHYTEKTDKKLEEALDKAARREVKGSWKWHEETNVGEPMI